MQPGKYTVKELFVNREIQQIIVPEIQRDYVWPVSQTTEFLSSIYNQYQKFKTADIQVQSADESMVKLFGQFIKKERYSTNIGFIYAYSDPEFIGKYFLIDGQQRLTTIYLLLLNLSIRQNKKDDFEKYFFVRHTLKIDYKVREICHLFMVNFFTFLLDGGKVEDVENQYWYFSSYPLDTTISSIIANYKYINSFSEKIGSDTSGLYNYILNYTDYWYFDTNISSQGEELYIYMNARGEQIQGNERDKAEALAELTEADVKLYCERSDYGESKNRDGLKKYWGKKWEEWQDFFWQNRGDNPNADNGFNNFLKCICGLENYIIHGITFKPAIAKHTGLDKIEIYIEALQFLDNEKENFKNQYAYAGWVDSCISLLWETLNKGNTNWLADFTDSNRSAERKMMMFVWPYLYYYEHAGNKVNVDDAFRILRLSYVRFHNNIRAVRNVKSIVDGVNEYGFMPFVGSDFTEKIISGEEENEKKIFSRDEKNKYRFLNTPGVSIREFESAIWKIEDHPLNLIGEDLENINVSHLVKFDKDLSLNKLELIHTRFENLFLPKGPRHSKDLQTLLLFYGKYWQKVKPSNYENYHFSNWGRIIRNLDGDAFQTFFLDYCAEEAPRSLKTLIKDKQLEYLDTEIEHLFRAQDLGSRLRVYSILLPDIWEFGNYVGIENYVSSFGIFDNEPPNSNKGRDFRSSYKYLYFMFTGNRQAAVERLTKIKTDLTAKPQPQQ